MNTSLRRCFLGVAAVYVIILGSLFYWHLCPDLNGHSANPRYYQMFKQARGAILDRGGELLAYSAGGGNGFERRYAAASLSHVVGYFHPRYGMTCLERIFHEDLLRGRELITTIDLEIQKLVEEIMGERPGGAIVLNPATGEILALVSVPCVDGNCLEENWPDYLGDLRSPFLNRITQGLYPPGSLVKPIVYAAALTEGLAEPGQSWDDQGLLLLNGGAIQNYGGRKLGTLSTDQALAQSSNVVFARLAVQLGGSLPEWYRNFGLGGGFEFELGSQKGFVPPKLASGFEAALLGIGQGKLLVTPLQMGVLVSVIANRGIMMQPYLVHELRGGFQLRQIARPNSLGRVLPEQVSLIVRDAMLLAVQEGTARAGLKYDIQLAAKTGTAQSGRSADHSWFMGFAPAPAPQAAAAVLVEHGGAGGEAAAPLGAAILNGALQILESKKGKR